MSPDNGAASSTSYDNDVTRSCANAPIPAANIRGSPFSDSSCVSPVLCQQQQQQQLQSHVSAAPPYSQTDVGRPHTTTITAVPADVTALGHDSTASSSHDVYSSSRTPTTSPGVASSLPKLGRGRGLLRYPSSSRTLPAPSGLQPQPQQQQSTAASGGDALVQNSTQPITTHSDGAHNERDETVSCSAAASHAVTERGDVSCY